VLLVALPAARVDLLVGAIGLFHAQIAKAVALIVLPFALVDLAFVYPVEHALALLLIGVPLADILVLVGCVECAVEALFVRLGVPFFPQLLGLFERLQNWHGCLMKKVDL